MGLFKADFFRSFAIGFAVGAALLAGVMSTRPDSPTAGQFIPAATAAPAMPDQTLIDPVVDRAR